MDPNQTKIYSAILIAAGILGIIVVYFIITIVRNQRRHLKLQQANLLLEITTLENERKRIVSDLHDELGPLLSVVKFQVSSLETSHPDDLHLIDKANENLDTILDRMRGICNRLMPQVLTRKGVIDALREYLSEVPGISGVTVNFSAGGEIVIRPDAGIHVFRIVQEIINNCLKHAHATVLDIRIEQVTDRLVITISDNGKGFITSKVQQDSRGYGLKNILSRVDILKGDLYLASEPGKGTTYTIELPRDEIWTPAFS